MQSCVGRVCFGFLFVFVFVFSSFIRSCGLAFVHTHAISLFKHHTKYVDLASCVKQVGHRFLSPAKYIYVVCSVVAPSVMVLLDDYLLTGA